LEAVVREATQEPKPILFIDEIHLLLGAGSASGSMDAANILKPALARGAIRVIDRERAQRGQVDRRAAGICRTRRGWSTQRRDPDASLQRGVV
jgi:hypothetical protein